MALVEFYIKNYLENGTLVQTERCFQTIPWTAGEPALIAPKVKASMGKSGSFDFSLYMDHPLYGAMQQYKTRMRVVFAGKTIFQGRVITIDKTFDRTRSVHCEGILSYLLDSHQEGTKEEVRPTVSVLTYMQSLLNQHNADVEEDKRIQLGEVPGQYSAAIAAEQQVRIPSDKLNQQFGSSTWNSTLERLEDLLNQFGGYMRIRAENGVNYLDWLDKYYNANINAQPISVANNLIDLGGTSELENLFTVVVPIGKSNGENIYIADYWPIINENHAKVNYIEVPELVSMGLYTDAELNVDYHRKSDYAESISKYGRIWKTVDFENANTPEKLFAYAKDWIKNSFMPNLTQWNVTAIDLIIPGESQTPLIVGDRVILTHPEVDQEYGSFTIIEAEYDLYDMDKSKYLIGIPNQQVNASYGVAQKQEAEGKSKGGTGGGTHRKPPPNNKNEEEFNKEAISSWLIGQYSYKTDWGNDIQLDDPLAFLIYEETLEEKDPDTVAKDTAIATAVLERTKRTKYNELKAEAARRGCAYDDPQLLIEFTPSLYEKQQTWKTHAEMKMYEDYNLSQVQAHALLNDSTGGSWLASLVDDDGEWTEFAYEKHVTEGSTAENLRQQAIRTRRLIQGETKQTGAGIIKTAMGWLTGGGLNIDNILNTSNIENSADDTKTKSVDVLGGSTTFTTSESLSGVTGLINRGVDLLNGFLSGSNNTANNGDQTGLLSLLGGAFSGSKDKKNTGAETSTMELLGGLFRGEIGLDDLGEQLTSKFNLTSKTVDIDGGDAGTAKIGKSQGGDWLTKINDTITYQDENGEWRTASGFVTAEDFHIRDIPSFKTRFAYIETAYISVAYLDTLLANDAFIKNITGNQIVAGTLIRAAAGYFTDAWAKDFHCTGGYLYTSETGSGSQYTVHIEKCYNYFDISEKDGVVTLSMTAADGSKTDKKTFNEKCYNDFSISEAEGVITISMIAADGSRTDTKTFNMASTQFFIDAVEAAEEKGREEGGGEITITIDDIYDTNNPPTGTTATTISRLIATTDKDFITFRVNAGGETKRYNIEL